MVAGDDRPRLHALLDHICIAFRCGTQSTHNSVGLLVRLDTPVTSLARKSAVSVDNVLPEGVYFLRVEGFCNVLSKSIEEDNSINDYYVFKILCLDRSELLHLKVLCRRFIERNQTKPILVPYGLDNLSYSPFDSDTMDWIGGQNGPGATCATFIMAFFKILQIELFEQPWPPRSGDDEFRARVIKDLQTMSSQRFRIHKPSKPFLDKQKSLVHDANRYRPEDVVSAVRQEVLPISQSTADILNQELIRCVSLLGVV